MYLELDLPEGTKDPRKAVEQAVKKWPSRGAIQSRGIRIKRIEDYQEILDLGSCN